MKPEDRCLPSHVRGIVLALCLFGGTGGNAQVFERIFSFKDAEATTANRGDTPIAGLVRADNGDFFGTTQRGGASGWGTVFKVTPAGAVTILAEFTGDQGANIGRSPNADLLLASDGNLYGTTLDGGTGTAGSVFKMTPAGEFTNLANFGGGGIGIPAAGLVEGSDGNFYGTTVFSTTSFGSVFRMTPGGFLSTLVEFTGTSGANKGSNNQSGFNTYPQGKLVEAANGDFYGMTPQGGAGDHGTIFRITKAGALTTLVEFTGETGANPGSHPQAGLLLHSDGNFYGTTERGGASDKGTVFKMTPAGVMVFRVDLTGTPGTASGSGPTAPLTEGSDGTMYGTTFAGGANGFGTVFRLTTTGILTTIAEFTNDGDADKGGTNPKAGLALGADGNFYGTTQGGGKFGVSTVFGVKGFGTVYKVTPNGEITTLADFAGRGNAGTNPFSGLIQDQSDGNFYGTTPVSGPSTFGTVYKITLGGDLTTLAPLDGILPPYPIGQLVKNTADGNFYGATAQSLYKITPGGEVTRLVDTSGYTVSGMVQGNDGNLYGMDRSGGSEFKGSVYRLVTDGSAEGSSLETLVSFTDNGSGNKGRNPHANLVQDDDGNFYGTTEGGGASDQGTVFRMTPEGSLTTLVEFEGNQPVQNTQTFSNTAPITINDGAGGSPYPSQINVPAGIGNIAKLRVVLRGFSHTYPSDTRFLLTGPNGETCLLMSRVGGINGVTNLTITLDDAAATDIPFTATTGTFRPAPNGGTGLSLFTPAPPAPYGSQLSVFSGQPATGTWSLHVVDVVSPDSGQLSGGWSLEFSPAISTRGAKPTSTLVKGDDGDFYGTTSQGGLSGAGTVFKISPSTGILTNLVDFTGASGPSPGSGPLAGLLKDADGNFYGTTSSGGVSNLGTVFRMSPSGALTTLFEFPESEAARPNHGPLIRGTDGNLYGTTGNGESSLGGGSVYRLIFPGAPIITNAPLSPPGPTSALVQARVNARGAATVVTLDYWTGGIDPPPSLPPPVPISTGINGFRTKLVGTTLTGLMQGTTYYYRFRAVSDAGMMTGPVATFSPVQSTTTLSAPVAVAIPATNIGPTSAMLNGTVNARNFDSAVVIEWGTDGSSFPNKVAATPGNVTGSTPVPVSIVLGGLDPGATFFYRIVASNQGGTSTSGTQAYRTLIPATATISGAAAISTTRAQVTGFVDAEGSNAGVSFEYGTDGISFPNSFSATPSSVTGDLPVEVSATLTGLLQGTTYHVRIRAQGPGGTGLSPTRTFSLSILSGLTQVFPDPAPISDGVVTVNFSPPSVGAWRFKGDTKWLGSGVPSANLTAGQRVIEYIPIPGFVRPPSETVEVTSSGSILLDRIYYDTPLAGSGSLTVRLKPDELSAPGLPEAGRTQWRIVGETNWRDSGGNPINGLAAGSYLVECKPVSGRETPATVSVSIGNNDSQDITLTYFAANTSVGASPLPQTFSNVSTNEDLPFAYLGQIRTEVGSGTGFVVKRRVVATAGHVVFDDGTLSAITDIQWFFQRHTGTHEPRPQVPRGYYLAAGYAAQRTLDNSPGEGSAQSQTLDYAALYFVEEAGRGGYGGYLASDSGDDNEFLKSTDQKILAGYPVDGILAADIGKLHATAPFTPALSPAFGETWTTTQVRGLGGISGGPLFIRNNGGAYLPAAIYLGGAGQTVVRAIDSSVVDLFFRAEVSGNGGDNNTGGGITHTSVAGNLNVSAPGSLRVIIEPAGVGSSGGSWKLNPETTLRPGGSQKSGLSPGTYSLSFAPVTGFQTPPAQSVSISGGQLTTVTFTYQPSSGESPLETWRQLNFGPGATNTGDAADDNDFDKDGVKNIDEFTAGTDPKNASDSLKISTATKSGATFTVGCAGKAGRIYTLQRNTALSGMWTDLSSQGPLATDGSVSLTDPSAPVDTSYYRIAVSMP